MPTARHDAQYLLSLLLITWWAETKQVVKQPWKALGPLNSILERQYCTVKWLIWIWFMYRRVMRVINRCLLIILKLSALDKHYYMAHDSLGQKTEQGTGRAACLCSCGVCWAQAEVSKAAFPSV